MNDFIDYAFNWKKNPTSVLFLAIPLFLIGTGLAITFAVFQIMFNNDWNYLCILLAIFMLGSASIIQLIMIHRHREGQHEKERT
jgi:uncharacterized transporter YbjL